MLILIYTFLIISCQNVVDKSLINTNHLDNNLYKEMVVGKDTSAFVYIYAEYPTYEPIEATGEGIACVDDVARAAIFYFRYYNQTQDNKYLVKAKNLTVFILHMQANNGLFYNFIATDYSINKTRKNSLAIADWWTWRALWALSEAMIYAKENEPEYYARLNKAFVKTMNGLADMDYIENKLSLLSADQSSVFLIALAEYSMVATDTSYYKYISKLATNIISQQKGDEENFPHFAFMSWRNVWHGWGNTQAYALLRAAKVTGNKELRNAVTNEVKYFYNYYLSKNHFKQFVLNDNESDSEFEYFEQIAYAIRPMVWASLELYNQTGEKQFAEQAGKLAAWLVGENVTQQAIYDEKSGRCYDGINSAEKINLNSGAESTIEALLTLIEVEKNPIASSYLNESFRKYTK